MYRWIKSSIFATAAVLFVVGPALADERANDPWCKKATLPSSIAICSDPELWALATERNRLFAELQRRLKPAAWRALQADQREWVHRYAGECGIEPDVAPDLPLAPQIKDCMLRAGQARIEYLRNYALPTPQPTTDATSQPKFPSPGSTSAKPPSPAPTSQNETPATSSASPTTPPGAQGPLQAERPPYLIAAILGTIVITGIGCAFYTRKESGGGRATSVVKTLPTVSTPSPPSDRPIIEPSPERRDQSAERLFDVDRATVDRGAVREMVEDFYRFVVLFEQNYADTHGPHYNIKEYEAAATEHALRWADRIEATASLMPPEQAKIFKEIAEEETVLLGQELKRNPKALSKRLGVEIGKRSPPVVYQRQSIGEMAIRTAVRATVWELIFSLFRR